MVFDLKLVLKCIKEVASKAGSESGIPEDYFKRKNYSQKQEQIKMLKKFLQVMVDIKIMYVVLEEFLLNM